jgi:GT2 family glycosyltransferase
VSMNLALVIATKDRPDDLRRLFQSLRAQTARPSQIVIVDASMEPVQPVIEEFADLRTTYLRYWPPSAAAQRNAGLKACDPAATLVGFVDDDATLEPRAVENMLRFWETADSTVLGASFNIRNYTLPSGQFLKRSSIAERLGLYCSRPGAVAPSGWQTVMCELPANQFVEWLPSGAVVWRRGVFESARFDEFFSGYSYLEDLDFSYPLAKRGALVVVADAGYRHFPAAAGRVSARQFGRVEVRNRLFFVRKHGLSLPRCYLGLAVRVSMTLLSGLFRFDMDCLRRAAGNVQGLVTPARSAGSQ